MARKREHIDPHGLYIDIKKPRCLRRIDEQLNPFLVTSPISATGNMEPNKLEL